MKSIRFNLIRAFFTISLLFVSVGLFAQQAVSGTVSDSDGNPIPGVSIVEKNTTNGTVSDFDGNFQLSVGENAVLMFSYIGYITIEQNATSVSMSVTLEEDLKRRDFTINSIAKDKNGNIIDPFNGKLDVEKKIFRHTSSAFVEDPLRVLRFARFKSYNHLFDFEVCSETVDCFEKIIILMLILRQLHRCLQFQIHI